MRLREPFDQWLRAELRALVSAAPAGLPPSLPTRRKARWIPVGAVVAAGVLLGLISTQLLPSRPRIGPNPTAVASFRSSPVPSKIPGRLDGWSVHDIDAALRDGVGAQIFDIARTGKGLVAVGFTAASGERRQPAAWTSSDGVSWTRGKVGAGSAVDGEPATELRAILPLDGELLGFAGTQLRSTVIYRSADDGHTWSPDPLASFVGPGVVMGATGGGPGYVAVGAMPNIDASLDFAGVWTSTDGLRWKPITPIGDAPGLGAGYLNAVASDGSVLVAVGLGARGYAAYPGVWRSTDGLSWTDVSSSVGSNLQAPVLTSVVATGHGFVAGGGFPGGRPGQGFWESRIWHSDDGSEWQLADLKVDAEGDIAQIVQLSDGRLVATGDLGGHAAAWVSSDAQTWAEDGPPTSNERTTVAAATPFGDGVVVAGSVVVDSGPDGSQAVSRPLAWLAPSAASSVQPSPTPPVHSVDVFEWKARALEPLDGLDSEARDIYGTERLGLVVTGWIAGPDGKTLPAAWWSSDGVAWQRAAVSRGSGDQQGADGLVVDAFQLGPALDFGDRLISFAIGNPSGRDGDSGTLLFETVDGRSWQPVLDGGPPAGGTVEAVTRGGPGFIAVGTANRPYNEGLGAMVWTSADGITWDAIPGTTDLGPGILSQGYLSDVASDGTTAVAVGSRWDAQGAGHPTVWTSTDGRSWSELGESSGVDGVPASVLAFEGGFAIGGSVPGGGGELAAAWVSADGTSWSKAEVEAGIGAAITDLAATPSGLVAVGDGIGSAAIWTSADGRAWAHQTAQHLDAGVAWRVTSFGGQSAVAGWSRPGGDVLERRPIVWIP